MTTFFLLVVTSAIQSHATAMPWLAVSPDKKGFVLDSSSRPFLPWGFNYNHDDTGRLIEDHWENEWNKIEAHFTQMKGRRLDRLLLGEAARRTAAVQNDRRCHDARLAGAFRAESEEVRVAFLHAAVLKRGKYHRAADCSEPALFNSLACRRIRWPR
jgi:hypothetical protein